MTDLDCYFFVDESVPVEDRTISAMHIECRDLHRPNQGWFYKGSVEGYGPFEYKCKICNGLIHEVGGDDEETEATD